MNSYTAKNHFTSGDGGHYIRNKLPRTYVINYLKPGNKYIRKISDRDFWDGLHGDLKEFYLKTAEKYADYVWKSVPAYDTYLNFFISGKVNEKYHFENRHALLMLVAGECIENKGRFIPQIINGIFCIAEQTTWCAPAHLAPCSKSKEHLPEYDDDPLDLQVARAGLLFAYIYGTMKEKLDEYSPVISRRVKHEVEKRVLKPYVENDLYYMGFIVDFGWEQINNWNTFINFAAIYCSLAVYDRKKELYPVITKAIDSLDNFVDIYPEDGACDEGPGYWYGAGCQLSMCIDLLDSCLTEKPGSVFDIEKIHNMMDYPLDTRICEDYCASVADAHVRAMGGSPEVMYNIGEMYNDEAFKNEAKIMYKFCNYEFAETFAPEGLMLTLFYYDKFIKCDNISDKGKKTVYFDSIQMMISRECEDRGKGLYLMSKGGHNGESHNHNDLGEVIVFKDGKPVMLDIGVATYDNFLFNPETRYTKHWETNGFNHSVPVIGGCAQLPGKNHFAQNVTFVTDEDGDTHTMELKGAYENEDKINSLVRTNSLNRKEKYVTVTDEYDFSSPLDYEAVFMLAQKPEIVGNKAILLNCTFECVSGEKAELACEEILLTDKALSEPIGERIYKLKVKIKDALKSKITYKIF